MELGADLGDRFEPGCKIAVHDHGLQGSQTDPGDPRHGGGPDGLEQGLPFQVPAVAGQVDPREHELPEMVGAQAGRFLGDVLKGP